MIEQSLSILPQRRVGTFSPLAMTNQILAFLPYTEKTSDPAKPRRKSIDAPLDNNTFVKPIKQCFVKNPRLMPMTRIMLTLISGWAGDGRPIETTIGIIAKHLGKSRRQVFRYLKDAVEEGYLFYSRTKNRKGMYTGVKLRLNLSAIRYTSKKQSEVKTTKNGGISDVTPMTDTNDKYILKTKEDDELWTKLLQFGGKLGYFEKDKDQRNTT
ncbi:hypothetical protein [Lewinella sp. LCG006]|uniref:hypothetical protein n=1 Tax=Lewinella sp. LCG006 TaxID=3231911 RepID=UPI0034615652